MKKSSVLILFFVHTFVFAQKSVQIKGKIHVADAKPSGVHIINLNTEEEVVSDENGIFTIEVQADQLLVFSADHLDYMRKIIENEDVEKGEFLIEMTAKPTILDDVEIVNYSRINAVSLGILAKPAKYYTPAVRRLRSGSSSPFDRLLNTLSGQKSILEDGVALEKKEFALADLDGLYAETFYTQTLKISKDEISGFQYYIVEDYEFMEALKTKKTFLVTFIMIKLAIDYKAIRNAE